MPESVAPGYKTVPCKLCGKPIVWGVDEKGARIPLDPRPPVYTVTGVADGVLATRTRAAMVSHFATCPKVGDLPRKPSTPATAGR